MPGIPRFGIVLVGAILIAVLGGRPYASSWNDGSRLASVESLVDQHTWAIDDSIFVKVPKQDDLNPYSLEIPSTGGTMDKMLIGGHFYSDKPPVVTLYLAGIYWIAQELFGLVAAQHPHVFVYLLTVTSAGLSYVLAVLCVWYLTLRLGLSANLSFLCTVSFGIATMAPVYSRQVNNHIMLLAALAAVFLLVNTKPKYVVRLGLLAGLAYTLDLGVGPVLILSTLIYCFVKWRNISSPLLCALGMLPFMALHHWLNYRIGGTFGPANANVQFFAYPGSAFSADNMTGVWAHHSVWSLVSYSVALLFGPRGFLLHNLPLLLIPFGAVSAWWVFAERRPELLFAALMCVGTWMVYAMGSNNYGGLSLSIRWFIPLLAPAFFGLAVMLQARPGLLDQFKVLTEFGALLTAGLFWTGPWRNPDPNQFLVLLTLGLAAFAWSLWRRGPAPTINVPAST